MFLPKLLMTNTINRIQTNKIGASKNFLWTDEHLHVVDGQLDRVHGWVGLHKNLISYSEE